MTKRLAFLLIDANIIIEAFRLGVWDALVSHCDIYLPEVMLTEALYYIDSTQTRHPINLDPYSQSGAVTVITVELSTAQAFLDRFDPLYRDTLHDGEAAALAYLFEQDESWTFCSADKIAFRVLGNANRSEQGLSLEEVLNTIGFSRTVGKQFTAAFRKKWTHQGFEEGLAGNGLLRPRQ